MTRHIKKLSKLIPKIPYSVYDLSILADMLNEQVHKQMQAQFDQIQMDTKEFEFKTREIRQILVHGIFVFSTPSLIRHGKTSIYLKLLRTSPRIFLALTMPIKNVPLYINRDYLGVFMRWRLLIQK